MQIETTLITLPKTDNFASSSATGESIEPSFEEILLEATNNVRAALHTADSVASQAMTGEAAPHEAMLALADADTRLRLYTQTRNKLVDAYQELMNIRM